MVGLVDVMADQPARCAAYKHIGGEVIIGKHAADTHC